MFPNSSGRLRFYVTIVVLYVTSLGGCAVVDQYSSRASEYNEQAATSTSSLVLLNIMRAAFREPLQFTDVSSVNGTASAQGSLSANIPLRVGGPNLTSAQILQLNPAAMMSGGPTFNVANLHNQEFYRGLQSPIDPQTIANYKAAGIPLKVLLPLLISDIEIDNGNRVSRIHNSASTEGSYKFFLSAIDDLVYHGLDLETVSSAAQFGPELTLEQARDPKLLSGLAQAIATASSGGGSSLSLSKVKGSSSQYQLNKGGSTWRFCFKTSRLKQPYEEIAYTFSERPSPKYNFPLHLAYGSAEAIETVKLNKTHICGSPTQDSNSSGAKQQVANLKFTTRSVEGIILFLGDVVRTELGIGADAPRTLEDGNGNSYYLFKADPNVGPRYLFKVEPRSPLYGEISANFAGTPYTISVDPSGYDASSQVVQLLSDLLALQSSAKNLPAPNVIAVVP